MDGDLSGPFGPWAGFGRFSQGEELGRGGGGEWRVWGLYVGGRVGGMWLWSFRSGGVDRWEGSGSADVGGGKSEASREPSTGCQGAGFV